MGRPSTGTTMDQLIDADRKAARLLRRTLERGEGIDLWAIGLDDQVVALSDQHCFIVKRGFPAGLPFGGRVTSLDYSSIVSAEILLGVATATATFQVRAEGMPGLEVWAAWRARRTRITEMPNAVVIAKTQVDDFQRLAEAILARAGLPRGRLLE